MEYKIVNKNFYDGMKVHSININSILFIKGNDLIKMPYSNKNSNCFDVESIKYSDIESILEYIETINGSYYILPRYMLYTSKVKTSNYKGYGMDYLKDYKPISEIIESNSYTHKEKIEICHKISDAITNLEKYKIAYWDAHSDNFLINNKFIKLCDMDSVTASSISGNLEYKKDLLWSYKHLTSLLLSILYGTDEMNLIGLIEDNRNSKFIRESEMFRAVISKEHHIFYPDKYLDAFTEEYVEDTKLILKR